MSEQVMNELKDIAEMVYVYIVDNNEIKEEQMIKFKWKLMTINSVRKYKS